MIIPDANLLLYAYDADSPFHEAARSWWQACLSGQEAVGLTHPTLFAFVRISTNARIYANPMTLAESAKHLQSWLARRVSQVLQAPADHVHQVVALLVVGPPATRSPTRRSRRWRSHIALLSIRPIGISCDFPMYAADFPWMSKFNQNWPNSGW